MRNWGHGLAVGQMGGLSRAINGVGMGYYGPMAFRLPPLGLMTVLAVRLGLPVLRPISVLPDPS